MIKQNKSLKKILFWSLQLFALGIFAQAPSLINYQGSARLANGIPLGNKTIGIKFEIREGSGSGNVLVSETQVLQTNLLGLFVTQIGKNSTLSSIDWQSGTKFLEVSIDTTGGSNYISLGTQQMVSVPYAMNASNVPSSYTGNTLTIGSSSFALTPTMAVTPNTSITVSGLGIVTSAGTNTFDINIPAPTFTGLGTATVSGTYPNYTVSSNVPTFTNTGQQIVTGAYPNFTVNTPSIAAVPDQTLTPSGIVTVLNPATNSFVIGVQSPTFTNAGQNIITGNYPNYTVNTPTVPAAITPTVAVTTTAAANAAVSSSGSSFSINVPPPSFTNTGQNIITGTYPNFTVNTPTVGSAPNQTLTQSGLVTVLNPATNSFVIGVQSPTFTNVGQNIITGTYPNFSVNTPTVPAAITPTVAVTTTVAASAGVSSSGSSFSINVPPPVFSNATQSIITGTYPNYVVNTPTVPAAITPTIAVTTTAAANAAVSSTGSSFSINVPAPAFTNVGPATITGSYPNYVINSTAVPNTSITVTSTAGATPSVGVVGTNSFNINIPPQATSWALLGNAGTVPATNFIGTSDLQDLNIRTNGTDRIKITSTGNVGVGSGYNPGAPFVAQGSGPDLGALKLYNSHGTGGDKTFLGFNVSSGDDFFDIARIGSERSGGGGEGRLLFMTGGQGTQAERMRIDEFGSVSINSTVTPSSHLFSIDNKSVTTRSAFYITGARDEVGAGMPLTIEGVTSGQVYNGNTFGRLLRFNNVTQNALYDMGIGSTGNFFLSNINNYSPAVFNMTSSGNVGINVSAPTASFQVNGTTRLVDGTQGAGKVLTSDASGNASWQAPASTSWGETGNAGTNPTTNFIGTTDAQDFALRANNTEVARVTTTGRLGVGTSAPSTNLHVHSSTSSSSQARFTHTATTSFGLVIASDNGSAAILNYDNTPFYIATGSGANRFSISNTGNVNIMLGVGLSNEKLNVDGNISLEDASGGAPGRIIGFPTAAPGNHGSLTLQAKSNNSSPSINSGGNLVLAGGDYNHATSPTGGYGGNVTIKTGKNVYNGSGGSDIVFQAGGSTSAHYERMRITGNSGFVGIGTSAPTATLHVVGSSRFVDGNQAAGKVLTSDASGNATWQTASGSGWGLTGNAGTAPGTNFVGTTDAQDLVFKSNNIEVFRAQSTGIIRMLTGADRTITLQDQTSNIDANALYVKGSAAGIGGQARNGGNVILQGGDGYNQSNNIHFGGNIVIRPGKNQYGAATYNSGSVIFQNVNTSNAYTEAMRVDPNGNLGIGVSTPGAKLHVAGTTRLVDGTEGAGKVLTSDASGNASWATPASPSRIRAIVIEPGSIDVGATTPLPASKGFVGLYQAPCVLYADGTTSQIQLDVPVPKDWNAASSFTVRVLYGSSTTAGNFEIGISSALIAINQDVGSATSGSNYIVAASTTNEGLMEVSHVISTNPAHRLIHLYIRRNGGSGSDTSTGVMRMFGVSIEYYD